MITVDRYARKIFGSPPRGFSSDSEFRERIERKPSGEIIGHGILIMRVVAGIDNIATGESHSSYKEYPHLRINVAYQYHNNQNEAGFYVGVKDPRNNDGPFMVWSKPSLWTPERFEEALMDIVQERVKR